MSKARKKARKAAKKVIGMCLKCGDPLRRKDARCKGCGRVSPLFQGKSAQRLSAPLFLAKGGNVVPLAGRWRCWGGHVNKSSASFCTGCGEYRVTTAVEHHDQALKAADPMRSHRLYDEWRAETRPGERERLWKVIHAETFGANPAALPAFIAKSEGRRSVHDLFTAESDPETAALYWRLSHPWVYGPEGGQSA